MFMIDEAIFKSLLLPIPFSSIKGGMIQFNRRILEIGIQQNELRSYVIQQLVDFNDSFEFSSDFTSILNETISASLIDDVSLGSSYISLLGKLHNVNPVLEALSIRLLLSELLFIKDMAERYQMSSSKIRAILVNQDSRLSDVTVKDISTVLTELGFSMSISPTCIMQMMRSDQEASYSIFADAELDDSLLILDEIGEMLGYPSSVSAAIEVIRLDDSNLKYVQMLHYQLAILEWYDHPLVNLYEFSPRSVSAGKLFERYEHLISTGNPFLNNAKGVPVMTEDWPDSRKRNEYSAAHSLFDVLKGFSSLTYPAAREFARNIRCWIERYTLSRETTTVTIDQFSSKESVMHFLMKSIVSPTNTHGIIEQRIVDFLSTFEIRGILNNSIKGVGDSVYASNYSKNKLGDIEVVDNSKLKIVAYEPHAGSLNHVYVEGHIKSFRRVLSRRLSSVAEVSAVENWLIKVIFVAHSLVDLPKSITQSIHGVEVEFSWITYSDLLSDSIIKDVDVPYFNSVFTKRLNSKYSPQYSRDYVIELMYSFISE